MTWTAVNPPAANWVTDEHLEPMFDGAFFDELIFDVPGDGWLPDPTSAANWDGASAATSAWSQQNPPGSNWN
jgi:hypothetical protein